MKSGTSFILVTLFNLSVIHTECCNYAPSNKSTIARTNRPGDKWKIARTNRPADGLTIARSKRSTSTADCPSEWLNPRDRFAQPQGMTRLRCADSTRQKLDDLVWGFNPVFGSNWRRPIDRFNFTRRWNDSTSHPSGPPPFVDSMGDLVIDLDLGNDTWSGEYICLYACRDDDDDDDDPVSSRKDADTHSVAKNVRRRRRVIWLTVYEPDVDAARELETLYIFVGLFGLAFFAVAYFLNADAVKKAIWRCRLGYDEPFTYVA